MMAQMRRLEGVVQLLQKQQKMVTHANDELSSLCDHLAIDVIEFSLPWTPIHKKFDEFIEKGRVCEDLKAQNEALTKRMSILLQERRTFPVAQFDQDAFERLFGVVQNLKQLAERKDQQILRLKFEHSFASRLSQLYAALLTQIRELHSVVGESGESMRPLILGILFANRLALSVGQVKQYNIDQLSVFEGRLSCAPDVHVSKVRSKLISLTEDLRTIKKENVELRQTIHNREKRDGIRDIEAQTHAHSADLHSRQLKAMRERMRALQEELARLVAPEDYDEVCANVEVLQSNIQTLEKANRRLHKQLGAQVSAREKSINELAQAQMAIDEEAANTEAVRGELFERDERIRCLEALVRDKNRELLSLERLLGRQKATAASENTTINALSVENQHLHGSFTPAQPMSEPGIPHLDGLATAIRPEFLSSA
jgi:hypothetical protein